MKNANKEKQTMKNRRSIVLTTIIAALLCAFAVESLSRARTAGAKNVTTNLVVPFDESIFNPAAGEVVHFAGDVHFIAHTKFLADGSVLVSLRDDPFFIPGTGDITGKRYNLLGHDRFQFGFKATDFPFTVSISCNEHIQNPGSCNDVQVQFMVEFT